MGFITLFCRYFDMLSGEMDYEIGSKIRHYITSGKDIYEEIKELEEIINEEDVAAKMTESEALLLTKRAELDQIKTKLLLFENKDFRYCMFLVFWDRRKMSTIILAPVE